MPKVELQPRTARHPIMHEPPRGEGYLHSGMEGQWNATAQAERRLGVNSPGGGTGHPVRINGPLGYPEPWAVKRKCPVWPSSSQATEILQSCSAQPHFPEGVPSCTNLLLKAATVVLTLLGLTRLPRLEESVGAVGHLLHRAAAAAATMGRGKARQVVGWDEVERPSCGARGT